MNKEIDKFRASSLFEGMTSIRAVLRAQELGISDRKIKEILFDKNITKGHLKELHYLMSATKKMHLRVQICTI